MKQYLVTISVYMPYPKEFQYRESAGGVHTAVARALKSFRKEVGRKRINQYNIKVIA